MKTYPLLGSQVPSRAWTPSQDTITRTIAVRTPGGWSYSRLTSEQKQQVGRAATEAYQAEVQRGNVTPGTHGKKTEAAQLWRHEEYRKVIGADTLDDATNEHFRALMRHFRAIRGTPAAAARSFRDSMRTGRVSDSAAAGDTHEARELWRSKLNTALGQYGYDQNYAERICRSKYKRGTGAATAEQLRFLFIAVTANGRKKLKAAGVPPSGGSTGPATPPKGGTPTKKLKIIKPGDAGYGPEPDDEDEPF